MIFSHAVNPSYIKTLLANCLSTFPIEGNPVFNNGPKCLPKIPPYSSILYNWVFDNFILADEPFAKALRSFETCVLVNNNLCGIFFHHFIHQQPLKKFSKLLQYQFLFLILIY